MKTDGLSRPLMDTGGPPLYSCGGLLLLDPLDPLELLPELVLGVLVG